MPLLIPNVINYDWGFYVFIYLSSDFTSSSDIVGGPMRGFGPLSLRGPIRDFGVSSSMRPGTQSWPSVPTDTKPSEIYNFGLDFFMRF